MNRPNGYRGCTQLAGRRREATELTGLRLAWTLSVALLGCSGELVGATNAPLDAAGSGAEATATGMPLGTGGAGPAGVGVGAAPTGTTSGAGAGATVGGEVTGGTGSPTVPAECATNATAGRSPLRRLTAFEYNNTVRDLLGDDTRPGNALPPELLGNGYGNDADNQPISSFLVEQYASIAGDVAARATATAEQLALLAPCAATLSPETEAACARSFIESWGAKAYRRGLTPDEASDLEALWQAAREGDTFESSIAAVIEAVLQSPDFLYKLETGEMDPANPAVLRPTGPEMAARLSYLFWGTQPDATLTAAAASGELSTAEGVRSHAERLLADLDRVRPVMRYFFDHFLPLNTLTDLARDVEQYPTFNSTIGALMREETQTFLENEIFSGPGTYKSILTAPYTYVNETLAGYYGIPGVVGEQFVRADVDPTKRLGLLTQGAIQTGTTISNFTNPVRRGVFLLRNMMCIELPDPPEAFAASVMPPDPYSGDTGRQRYTAHSAQATCSACHAVMDPPGFGLENYDAVGLWRDTENGVPIDASGTLPSSNGAPFSGPIDLVNVIANDPQTYSCFARNWMSFAYGRSIDDTQPADTCSHAKLEVAFHESGYGVKELLVALTQTDAFLTLAPREP